MTSLDAGGGHDPIEETEQLERTEAPRMRQIMALVRLALLFGLAVGVIAAFKFTPLGELLAEERMNALLESLGPATYPLWILLYGVLLALWIPGTPMTAIGAAVFGPAVAIPLNYAGAVLGAVIGFVVARVVGGRSVEELLSGRVPLYGRYERLLRTRGFEAVLYLRLIPTPYNVLSYVAGLSPLSLRRYTLATAIGILPGSIAFTYLLGALVEAGRQGDFSALLDLRTLAAIGGYVLAASIPAFLGVLRRRYGWFVEVGADE